MNTHILAHNGLLRKDHQAAGFSVRIIEDEITVWRHGVVWERYGYSTPIEDIHRDIDQLVELQKCVEIDLVIDQTRERQEYQRTWSAETNRRAR